MYEFISKASVVFTLIGLAISLGGLFYMGFPFVNVKRLPKGLLFIVIGLVLTISTLYIANFSNSQIVTSSFTKEEITFINNARAFNGKTYKDFDENDIKLFESIAAKSQEIPEDEIKDYKYIIIQWLTDQYLEENPNTNKDEAAKIVEENLQKIREEKMNANESK